MERAIDYQSQSVPRLAAAASRAEQFSIWAMRLWWCGFPEIDSVWPDFAQGFRACGVAPALESCHRICSIALATAGCGNGIACLHCPHIAPAEEQLLAALVAANSGESDRSEMLFRQFLPATAARLVAPQAVHYAQILTHAGLLWPPSIAIERAHRALNGLHSSALSSDRLH